VARFAGHERKQLSSGLVHGAGLLGEPDGLRLPGVHDDEARDVHLVRHPHELADDIAPGGQVEVQLHRHRPAGARQHQPVTGAVEGDLVAVDDRRHDPVALPRLIVPAKLPLQKKTSDSRIPGWLVT
jgi:hypothetical protein